MSQWISVNERLPEEDVRVWSYAPGLQPYEMCVCYRLNGEWRYGANLLPNGASVTHWQSLPEPPETSHD